MTWRCERCETVHETDDPPCDECGNDELVSATESASVETVESFVWACSACGREHVKNSPPCARCGNPILERSEPSYDVPEPTPGSYLSVAKPYLPVVALVAVVVGLTAGGVVTLDMLPGYGPPSPPDAPGDGAEAAGIDLEAVENGVFDRLEEERRALGYGSRSHHDQLRTFATHRNRERVLERTTGELESRVDVNEFDLDCAGSTVYSHQLTPEDELTIDRYDDESGLAGAIVGEILGDDESAGANRAVAGGYESDGIDVHVANEFVFVTYVTC